MKANLKEPLAKLNHIKESLQKRDVYPALEWAKENRSKLDAQVIINTIVLL